MKFIEVSKKVNSVEHRSLVNVEDIVAIREVRTTHGAFVAFIHTRDGSLIETDMRYSDVVSLLKQTAMDAQE